MDVPSLPGCISEGETEEEALANIKEAIELYLEPIEDEMFITESRIVKEITIWVEFQIFPTQKLLKRYKELGL